MNKSLPKMQGVEKIWMKGGLEKRSHPSSTASKRRTEGPRDLRKVQERRKRAVGEILKIYLNANHVDGLESRNILGREEGRWRGD